MQSRVVRVAAARKGEKVRFELPLSIQNRIKQLMKTAGEGHELCEGKNLSVLQDVWQKQHGRKLDVSRFGFRSFSSAMLTVQGVCLERHRRTALVAFFEGSRLHTAFKARLREERAMVAEDIHEHVLRSAEL